MSFRHLKVNSMILYWILNSTGNQCSCFNTGVMCSCLFVRHTSLAAEFCTLWSFCISRFGTPYKSELQKSNLEVTNWLSGFCGVFCCLSVVLLFGGSVVLLVDVSPEPLGIVLPNVCCSVGVGSFVSLPKVYSVPSVCPFNGLYHVGTFV